MTEKIIDDNKIAGDKAYEARGIIAKINPIGNYEIGPNLKTTVFQFLSLDCGPGRERMLVEFVGPAPYDEKTQELDLNKVKEGDIVVNPGFLYRKRPWTQAIMSEHLKQLKKYKPKVIIKPEVDRSEQRREIVIDPHNLNQK